MSPCKIWYATWYDHVICLLLLILNLIFLYIFIFFPTATGITCSGSMHLFGSWSPFSQLSFTVSSTHPCHYWDLLLSAGPLLSLLLFLPTDIDSLHLGFVMGSHNHGCMHHILPPLRTRVGGPEKFMYVVCDVLQNFTPIVLAYISDGH